MGKKYIVEVGRLERLYKASVNGNGKPNLTWLSPEFDLTPYTESDLEQVRKEGYKEGREAGIKDGKCEAWEAVRKIYDISQEDRLEIFPEASTFVVADICDRYSASECIEKIQAYEQEEIKVGDEVELKCGVRPAIYMQGTKGSDEIYLLFNDGSCGVHSKSEIERKTGRHFHEIATILENMRGEQDGET